MNKPKPLYKIGDQLKHKSLGTVPFPMTVMDRFYLDRDGLGQFLCGGIKKGWRYDMLVHPTAAYRCMSEVGLVPVEDSEYEIVFMAILNDLYLALRRSRGRIGE